MLTSWLFLWLFVHKWVDAYFVFVYIILDVCASEKQREREGRERECERSDVFYDADVI